MVGIPGYPGIDSPASGGKSALHDGQISLARGASPELFRQKLPRLGILGGDNDSGGVLVQPVYNTRPDLSGWKVVPNSPAMPEDRVHQGPRPVAAGRVYHHALRLVNNQDVAVLVEYMKVDGFRFNVNLRSRGVGDLQAVPR